MDYELLVIGGGAAGLAAATTAAGDGMRVALVSDGPLGGDCTFTGCVPSKTLIAAAAQGSTFGDAMRRVRATVGDIAATETAPLLRRAGVEVIGGRARVVGGGAVTVDGTRLAAGAIIIATGSQPAIPPIDGLADTPFLTTDTVFELRDKPDSMAILGAGPVGCELAQAFCRLGVDVCVVDTADRLLPGIDADAAAVLTEVFVREGIRVHTNSRVDAVYGNDKVVTLRLNDNRTVTAAQLLVATGRVPDTKGLDLAAAGVRTDEQGFITVDRHLATTAADVFAVGDVTGLFPHTHAAYAMGRDAVGAARHRLRRPSFDPGAIPRVIFTDPEIGVVGSDGRNIGTAGARVAYLPFAELDRAIIAGRVDGFVKIVAGPRPVLRNLGGGRILGATIVAPHAGEMIHEPALAMRTRMFTGRLAQAIHAYPSWSMAIQQAAAQFFGEFGGRRAQLVQPESSAALADLRSVTSGTLAADGGAA
ncbi:FAD-dependent oxidoreductase [Mycobacterium sp.]|uniref:dihydrolipoyl dehydrogenase family protein n=1 Tax=Mycobacterium sp. TaxID=1785 RepID=UPI0031CF9DE3